MSGSRKFYRVLAVVLATALVLSGCGKKNKEKGSQSSSGSGKDAAEQYAQDFAADYGIDMPDGIVSLADPDAVYGENESVQFNSMELFMKVNSASDWIDSEYGLDEGEKYISLSIELNDYGSGSVKTIPAPEHYYLIEARDADGNAVELGENRLKPVTDMPADEIMAEPDFYYNAAKPYESYGMDLWLLYKVPESVREVVLAVFTNDEFSQPHDAAFRVSVAEKHDRHTFRNWSVDDILAVLDTSERPELEEFAWYTPYLIEHGYGWTIPYDDPSYNGYEYTGGWKCYMYRDQRPRGGDFEAHLCNVYLENFEPEKDEYYDTGYDIGLGYMDVRIDWYRGFNAEGNVIDEEGLPDLVIPHEQFYYNRLENEDGTLPFLTFTFYYMCDRAVARGTYQDENGDYYQIGLVRSDGYDLWLLDEDAPHEEFSVLPGTFDVPLPDSIASGRDAAPKATASDEEDDEKEDESIADKGSGLTSRIGAAALDDFDWYFDDAFPMDSEWIDELQDLGGEWKILVDVVFPDDDGGGECMILVGNADLSYMGYNVDLDMDAKWIYTFDLDNPDDISEEKANDKDDVTFSGDWEDTIGYLDLYEYDSGLNLFLLYFAVEDGVQYAIGDVYIGDESYGEVAMVRP